jgi:ArsR family transcriptional regulator
MPPTELDLEPLEDLASVFKGLSDPTRLAILGLLLLEEEMCVCDIENVLGITQSRSSRHLRYLANARLVSTKRVGPWVHYRITTRKDPARLAVIDTLRKTLHGPGMKGIEKRLAQWKRTKGSSCAAAPTKPEVSHV